MRPPRGLPQRVSLSKQNSTRSVSAAIILPVGPGPQKQPEAARPTPQGLWCISFYKVTTSRAQQRNVRRTNTRVSLAENPPSLVLSRVCFSKTSSRLCPRQENTPSRLCQSKTPSDPTDFPKKPHVSTPQSLMKYLTVLYTKSLKLSGYFTFREHLRSAVISCHKCFALR